VLEAQAAIIYEGVRRLIEKASHNAEGFIGFED